MLSVLSFCCMFFRNLYQRQVSGSVGNGALVIFKHPIFIGCEEKDNEITNIPMRAAL